MDPEVSSCYFKGPFKKYVTRLGQVRQRGHSQRVMFDVVVDLNITFCVGNMLISVNMGPEIYIKFCLIFSSEFLGSNKGEGSKTKDDKV